jgi:transposase-like protein
VNSSAHAYPVSSVWAGSYGDRVPRPGFPRSVIEFQRLFPDEQACRAYLFESRWPDGFSCPACGSGDVGVEHRRHLWQCQECGRQTSATAGTVMHKTRLPLALWFWAAYLVATHGPGISALQMQRQLGISRYETAWAMLHKLRRAMVAPERELLSGEVEVDEGFLGGRDTDLRGGRQRDGKPLVGVAVEVLRQRLGPAAAATPARRVRPIAHIVRAVERRSRRNRPHGWVAGLQRPACCRLRPSIA